MNVLIYENYDFGIHGNQRYLMLLLSGARRLFGDSLRITLVVPSEGVFYQAARKYGEVVALNKGNLFARSLRLWRMLRIHKPDIVLCNNEASLLTILPAAMLLRAKVIWQIKNLNRSDWSDLLGFLASKRVLSISRQSVDVKNSHITRLFKKKIFVQRIGTRLDDFTALPLPIFKDNSLHVLALIFISADKGADTLIKALEVLDGRDVCAHLKVAGITPSGEEQFESSLKGMAQKFRHIKVEWLGWQEDVLSLIAWSHILVHPSRKDGVPRSIIEAMASARPVIASGIGGIPESIADGKEGFLIRPGDFRALADRLELLANDRGAMLKLGMAGRERAQEEYDIDRHIKQLKTHFEKVAGCG